ncbi:lytic transglycosylase domain-containing protein [Atopobium deltae]|uniref:Transglycosylase SLT domain protein n=1 Tax=Atopobium deltae TaxID=1393034 RepID=A0A133XXH8_9ACTN|nr:lytic transglycosylase domain-containing protein [Atopobium deltae]KXB35650.1 transglycosylase SLT domain protein [Atopobium deltae]
MRIFGRKKLRFFRWFRILPLLVLVVLASFAYAFEMIPAAVARPWVAPVKYNDAVVASAARHNVDPYLACAVIRCESNWNPQAQSSVGAKGLMQLMPKTAQELADLRLVDGKAYDPKNLFDPKTNIEYGCAYLSYLQKRLKKTDKVIAAYNAGIGRVKRWSANLIDDERFKETISYPETALYVKRVELSYAEYKRLWPQGIA